MREARGRWECVRERGRHGSGPPRWRGTRRGEVATALAGGGARLAAAEVVRAIRLGFGGGGSTSSSGPVEAEGPAAASAGADGVANLDASTDS